MTRLRRNLDCRDGQRVVFAGAPPIRIVQTGTIFKLGGVAKTMAYVKWDKIEHPEWLHISDLKQEGGRGEF